MRSVLLALVLLMTMSPASMAQSVITLDSKLGSSVSRETIFLGADGFRMEGASSFTIFRPEQNVLYDVTPARQRYTRVTSERLRQAAVDFDNARRDWSDKLKALSEERRRQAEAAFGPATASSKSTLVFAPSELTATFHDRHCRMLYVMLEGVQHGSVCIMSLTELGLTAADLQVLRRLTDFMSQGPRPAVGIASFWDLAAIEGATGEPAFPIDTMIAVPSGWIEYTVLTVERRPAPANAFDLPQGLTEETMPPPRGG